MRHWGAGLFALAWLASAALALIGTQGLFGTQPDGLAAVWLIFVGMPWSLGLVAIDTLLDLPDWAGMALAYAAPGLTLALILRLGR
ncbi:hypothetical protein [Litorisediminicola beolgyonensis]|uniref:Iron uptake protein n=1 Tax=Litorisediminicola beolgyonensis TaxID=1173614 RepID=A0ABW3ZLF0_9RHOB